MKLRIVDPDAAWTAIALIGVGLGLFGALVGGCRVPPPGTPAGVAIKCTTEAVRDSWPTVLPRVNTCLTQMDSSWEGCLDAIPSAVGVAIDVVACVVRNQGSEFAHAAETNPGDKRSARGADRAREYLQEKGWVFAE
ncbi:MAG TPA: hypothetical protein VEA41_02165 [Salinarimonas sp.]|nr:hypothetical protein [Salinarimonas sp.]